MENRYKIKFITFIISLFSSKNIQLFNFSSKDDSHKQRPWLSSNKTGITRQMSSIESSTSNKILNDSIIINSINDKNNHENSYQRSISIENATIDDYIKRSNRAVSVEPNLISGGNDIKHIYQQKTLPNGSTMQYDSTTIMNKQFTLSSDKIDQSISKNGFTRSVGKYQSKIFFIKVFI